MDYVRVQPTPSVATRDARVFMITADLADPAYQAYLLLRNAFTIALILAGADKFLNAMIDWVQYLAPVIPQTLRIAPEVLMRGVGVVEIGLGIWLSLVPRRAAYWVAGWLGLIVINSAWPGRTSTSRYATSHSFSERWRSVVSPAGYTAGTMSTLSTATLG